MVKRISKIENLMKLSTSFIKLFSNQVIHLEDYKEAIAKGLPFLTEDDITGIKKQYVEGVTWEDIDCILSKKGLIFKHDNFKKYLRQNLIAKQYKQIRNSTGKTAVYPTEIIMQINFIQYYLKSSSTDLILSLQQMLNSFDKNGLESLECVNDNLQIHDGNRTNISYLKIREVLYSEDIIDSDIYTILSDDKNATEEYSKLNRDLEDAFDKYIWPIGKQIEDLLKNFKSIYIPKDPGQELGGSK